MGGSLGQNKAYDHGKVKAMNFMPNARTSVKKLHSVVFTSNVKYDSWKLFHWKETDTYMVPLF